MGYGITHQYICKKVALSAGKLTTILHTKLLNNFKFRIKLNKATDKLPVVLIMLYPPILKETISDIDKENSDLPARERSRSVQYTFRH